MFLDLCPLCREHLEDEYKTDSELTTISTICLSCFNEVESTPHDDLSASTREYIDNLPFGVIIIDEEDKVINYNKTEAKLTGFSPNNIIGKNFFTEVAPCTSVDRFQGSVKELRKGEKPNQIEFDFTFNHLNFFARVLILLTYDPITKNTVISVKKISEEEDLS